MMLNATRSVARAARPAVAARLFSASAKAAPAAGNKWAYRGAAALVGGGTLAAGLALVPTAHAKAPNVDWDGLRKDIEAIIEAEDKRRGDGTGIGPTFVRLAWHASGTYSKVDGTGGSNGATMRFCPEGNWGANQGLCFARRMLEPLKAKYGCSYADLWTFASKVSIEYMGGPQIPWRPGRTDADDGSKCVPDGRLPDANQGAAHVRDVFGRMGFNDEEMVALIGAHALGRCHLDNSGYWGPWTRAETTFSNEYFKLLLNEKWTPKKTHKGKPWKGPLQYETPDGALMMTVSDMSIVSDPEFKKYAVAFANDEELFFKKFAAAYGKLMELGVPAFGKGAGAFDSLKGALGLKK